MKKLISAVLSLTLAACLLAACGNTAASSETVSSEVVSSEAVSSEASSVEESSSEAAETAAEATFTVVDADGNSTEIPLTITDGEKLSDALAAAGFVTTVNGVTADYNADGAWWCLTDAAGEMTTVGVADIELHDGDSYAFTYTK